MAKTVPVEVTVVWNAAAMRAALEHLMEFTCNSCENRLCEDDVEYVEGQAFQSSCGAIIEARKALAAPARNVDKLETKEAALAALKERFPVEENFAGFEMAVEWLLDTQDFCLAWPVSHRFGFSNQEGGAS